MLKFGAKNQNFKYLFSESSTRVLDFLTKLEITFLPAPISELVLPKWTICNSQAPFLAIGITNSGLSTHQIQFGRGQNGKGVAEKER